MRGKNMQKEIIEKDLQGFAFDTSDTASKQQRHLCDPLGDGISSLELIRVSGSDVDIVNAARVSYGKITQTISDRDVHLINFLIEHDHTSPFEHNQLSFRVKAPIYVQRQWFRHRMNSYNEISYRYVKSSLEFYVPTTWRKQDMLNKQSSFGTLDTPENSALYKKAVAAAGEIYEQLLAAGVCREQARGVLPLCTYTEFIVTCNLHSLMHFIRLRTHTGAQYEIRMYAEQMLRFAEHYFPLSLQAFKKKHGK